MNAKTAPKFKKPEEYEPVSEPAKAVVREVYFRLKLMPATLVRYSVEQVTVLDDLVIERKVTTERDILAITLAKIEDALIAQLPR